MNLEVPINAIESGKVDEPQVAVGEIAHHREPTGHLPVERLRSQGC